MTRLIIFINEGILYYMQKAKHSKFKNTGILFELLTKQVTADILSGSDKSPAKDLLFKYFNEGRELGKEWQIYSFLVNERFTDEIKADRAISIALRSREKLNSKTLNEEKFGLIREIKEIYPIEKFLKSNVKDYKVYASIYKLLENNVFKSFNVRDISQARNCLVESLVNRKHDVINKKTAEEQLMEDYKNQDEDIRLLTYKILVDNLNDKYKGFNDSQKHILREYINNVSNTNKLDEFVKSEKESVKKQLLSLVGKIDSQIVKIKIAEVLNQLNNLNLSKGVKDNHMVVLLLSHELVKEIKKNI